jgi:hypothetical protein
MHRLRLADEIDGSRAKRYRPRFANFCLPGLQKGSAAYDRKHCNRGLAGTEANVMYPREECLVHASACREKAQADPARSDYWIDRAIVWHQRAVQVSRGKAVTYAIHGGRLVSKPAK